MRKRLTHSKLCLLSMREVQVAQDGDHKDGGGLFLRVRGTSASWVFRYTSPSGRRREMGVGVAHRGNAAQTGESTVAARKKAQAARDLVEQGMDPIDTKASQRSEARQAEAEKKAAQGRQELTLARAARAYHERYIEATRSDKHAAQWLSSLENHIPASLWHAPLPAVTAPSLLAALLAIRPHERARNLTKDAKLSETVGRIRQRLEAVFEDAIFHGHCASNPAAAVRRKLAEGQPRRERGQFKALSYREAPALLSTLRDCPGVAARCLEFAVLTASRTSEALLAEWSEIDMEAGVWVIPAERMKGKEQHVVPLSPRALEILKEQKVLGERIVFPSTAKPNSPMSNMALLATLGRLGVRDRTTVHGLCRATFSTWANETGAARPDVIEACLAHEESNRVRASYNRAQFAQERRALLESWAEYLSAPTASNVLPLKAA